MVPELEVAQNPEFRNLRSFRSHNSCIPSEDARSLLSNSIKTKTLTSFDIVFPEPEDWPPNVRRLKDSNIRHLGDYEWLRGTRSIQTLGCYRFHFGLDAENDEDLPLPQFLASFPNLRTLSIDSMYYKQDEFASVVVAIMKRTHLKTIYTTSVKGEVALANDVVGMGGIVRASDVYLSEVHVKLDERRPED
ncbi:uncharacterized protein CPUR_03471 [Claviceps purpurea 20.1]|uniref:F-box domain-containing protein n=1 Tax=Claviceps purpurea (strain 20.1) TaxID=1111077 RepID=M1WDS5_CLAP2|nr:uncharacterized protein CPUR_03471 [Claviceps purpurea 20.1]